MKPPLDTVRVSQRGKELLISIKRKTRIENWNVVCRWALCDSLANPNKPIPQVHPEESNVEMKWDVFAGDSSELLIANLNQRAYEDGISSTKEEMAAYFRAHLERGISQLQSVSGLTDLFDRIGGS